VVLLPPTCVLLFKLPSCAFSLASSVGSSGSALGLSSAYKGSDKAARTSNHALDISILDPSGHDLVGFVDGKSEVEGQSRSAVRYVIYEDRSG